MGDMEQWDGETTMNFAVISHSAGLHFWGRRNAEGSPGFTSLPEPLASGLWPVTGGGARAPGRQQLEITLERLICGESAPRMVGGDLTEYLL